MDLGSECKESFLLTQKSSLKAAILPCLLHLQRSSRPQLARFCHMRDNLLQEPREEAPSTSAMPHPDDGQEAITKSPYQRSAKRQATERSTAPSLVATLPDELLLKVVRVSRLCPFTVPTARTLTP